MTLNDVLPRFGGSKAALAKALGITRQAINAWAPGEPIPEMRELQLRYEILPALEAKQQSDAA